MTDKLIIYLHANDASQCIWTAGETIHVGDTEFLHEASTGREVIVLVPARDVLLLSTQLPKMNRSRTLQALPFALEEQLIADVEELHFALQDVDVNGQTPVAVTAITKMHEWIAQLKEWGVKPAIMLSSVYALPDVTNDWQVAVMRDNAVVRDSLYHGFGAEVENLALLLQSSGRPEKIHIHNYTSDPVNLDIGIPVEETFVQSDREFFTHVASNNKLIGINLLQGAFAVKGGKGREWRLGWKVVTTLAAAIVAVLFVTPIVSSIILASQLSSINKQIAVIYKHHFPQSASIVAPKQRLQEKWQQLASATSDSQVLLQLGILGKALERNQGIKITRYDFQNGDANIELTATDSDSFTQFTDFLTDRGLNVKQQNANLVGGRINASIQITAA